MSAEPITIDTVGGRQLWRPHVLLEHVRSAKRQRFETPMDVVRANAELDVMIGGPSGPIHVKSALVAESTEDFWTSFVFTQHREAAIAVASSLASVLGPDGWMIEPRPSGFLISKRVESRPTGG